MKQDFSKLDRLLRRFADEKSVPGCAMAIMQGDRIIYENYTGCADIASGKKVTAGSMFRQASSKAAAEPQMPGIFSVPARLPRS